jgi:hypothetical protein
LLTGSTDIFTLSFVNVLRGLHFMIEMVSIFGPCWLIFAFFGLL